MSTAREKWKQLTRELRSDKKRLEDFEYGDFRVNGRDCIFMVNAYDQRLEYYPDFNSACDFHRYCFYETIEVVERFKNLDWVTINTLNHDRKIFQQEGFKLP